MGLEVSKKVEEEKSKAYGGVVALDVLGRPKLCKDGLGEDLSELDTHLV